MKHRYTTHQLRHMLAGKRWSDFKRPKAYKYNRVLNVGQVFFTLRIAKFLLRPSLQVRADGQLVVLQFIEPACYELLSRSLRWSSGGWEWESQTLYLGYIVNTDEDHEPVQVTQDVAGRIPSAANR
jgi:hypothetical protein